MAFPEYDRASKNDGVVLFYFIYIGVERHSWDTDK